jgi:hypothetical protein
MFVMQPPASLFDVSCVLHVHSTYSDGTATIPELLAAARVVGAAALLVTDHDSLQARRDGWEGMHNGVLLLVGVEISPKQGHYLAFGLTEEIPHAGRSALEIADAVRAAGGIGFAAHPFSAGGHMLIPSLARRIVLPHGWPALDDPRGYDGLELWSLTTDAAEAWRTPAEAVRWLRDPQAEVAKGPPADHLRRWDALSAHRRVPAVGGLDGHQPGIRFRGRVHSPMSHARTFDLLRTHLLCDRPLSGELQSDRATVLRALAEGRAWLTCPFVAPAHGSRLWADRADGQIIDLGGEGPAGSGQLRVRLPQAAEIRVIRDAACVHRTYGASVDVGLKLPGVYRVEARIDGRLWLLSNPIHLRASPM